MIPLKHLYDTHTITKSIGQDFSFGQKLSLRGVGSPKIIYQSGISFFDALANSSESHNFCNLQLYPNGLLITLNLNSKTQSVIVKRNDIKTLNILARRIKVRRSTLIFKRYNMVHDAKLTIELEQLPPLEFYMLTSHYKIMMRYLKKSWLKEKLQFHISSAEPVLDRGDSVLNLMNHLFSD